MMNAALRGNPFYKIVNRHEVKMMVMIPLAIVGTTVFGADRYEATWESLDRRPMPQWWADAKFGIFVCWGPYSVPAYAPTDDAKTIGAGYAEWYQGKLLDGQEDFKAFHSKHYGRLPYGNFAASFSCGHFNAEEWAGLFKSAGAKYVVLTSKYHDGYALWPSPETPYYNSVAMGPGRDICGEFTEAMRRAGLRSGFYYSLIEFANPLYPKSVRTVRASRPMDIRAWSERVNLPQMKDLVMRYKPDIIWPDGDWDYPYGDFLSERFLAWLFNESPVRDSVVVNDRWGKCRGRHGGHYTTEYGLEESGDKSGLDSVHPWEENRGIGFSYGYNRFETPDHYMTREKAIETLVRCVSAGGNLLLNVGPTADGLIPPIMQDRLLAIGRWLHVNGEAIYGTTRGDSKTGAKRVYFTRKGDVRYAIDFRGDDGPFAVTGVDPSSRVSLVGSDVAVETRTADGKLIVVPPALAPVAVPCEHAWVYRIDR